MAPVIDKKEIRVFVFMTFHHTRATKARFGLITAVNNVGF